MLLGYFSIFRNLRSGHQKTEALLNQIFSWLLFTVLHLMLILATSVETTTTSTTTTTLTTSMDIFIIHLSHKNRSNDVSGPTVSQIKSIFSRDLREYLNLTSKLSFSRLTWGYRHGKVWGWQFILREFKKWMHRRECEGSLPSDLWRLWNMYVFHSKKILYH